MFEYAIAILKEEMELLQRLISETNPIKSMKKYNELQKAIEILKEEK